MKKCTKCNEFKDVLMFYRQKASSDGFSAYCKVCDLARAKEWRINNAARKKLLDTNYRKNHPGLRSVEAKKYRAKYPDKAKLATATWKKNHPDMQKEARKRRYQKHRDTILKKAKEYRATDPVATQQRDRRYYIGRAEKAKAYTKFWRAKNPDKVRIQKGKELAARTQATPLWNSEQDREIMQLVYAEAIHRGLEVDHIVPLNGKNVCGLHVYWNTQLLTKKENTSKSNRWPYESRVSL